MTNIEQCWRNNIDPATHVPPLVIVHGKWRFRRSDVDIQGQIEDKKLRTINKLAYWLLRPDECSSVQEGKEEINQFCSENQLEAADLDGIREIHDHKMNSIPIWTVANANVNGAIALLSSKYSPSTTEFNYKDGVNGHSTLSLALAKGWTHRNSSSRDADPPPMKDFICALVDKGVEIDTQDNDGRTPLHYAAMHGDREAVTYLLAHGASVMEDKRGYSPRDYLESDDRYIKAILDTMTGDAFTLDTEARMKLRKEWPTEAAGDQIYLSLREQRVAEEISVLNEKASDLTRSIQEQGVREWAQLSTPEVLLRGIEQLQLDYVSSGSADLAIIKAALNAGVASKLLIRILHESLPRKHFDT